MQQECCWQAACHLTTGQLAYTPTERRGLNGRLDVISAVYKADPTECNRIPHTHTHTHLLAYAISWLWIWVLTLAVFPFPFFRNINAHKHRKALTSSRWLNGRWGPTGLCWHNTKGELPPLNYILYLTGVWLLSRIPQLTHSRLYIHPCSTKPCKRKGKGWCDIGTVDIRMRRLQLDCESIDFGCLPFGIELNW